MPKKYNVLLKESLRTLFFIMLAYIGNKIIANIIWEGKWKLAEITISEALDRVSKATKEYIDISITNASLETDNKIEDFFSVVDNIELIEMLNEELL